MSIQQAAEAAVQVFPNTVIDTPGGRLPLRVVMVAIAGRQSGWNPRANGDAKGTCPGCYGPCCYGYGLSGYQCYTSWGLWQIHNSAHRYLEQRTGSTNACVWAQWLYDPVHNAEAAYYLYQVQGLDVAWGGGGSYWTANQIPKFLKAAQAAVAAAEARQARRSPAHPASGPSVWVWIGLGAAALGGTAVVLDITGVWNRLEI
jgi:hypothetical protein